MTSFKCVVLIELNEEYRASQYAIQAVDSNGRYGIEVEDAG
jgi:hypothetical protein